MSNEMVQASQGTGRSAQKARTRAAIIEAARQLDEPTVEQAADAAGVSRATAYRYFPTQEALSVELASVDVWKDVDALVNASRSSPVETRLSRVIEALVATVWSNERQVRTALRVYHDTGLRDPAALVRRGRRMEWIDTIIAPLPDDARAKLRLALALGIGPDPVVMLKDIAGIDIGETKQVLQWAAGALLRAALEEVAAARPTPDAAGPASGETRRSAPRKRD